MHFANGVPTRPVITEGLDLPTSGDLVTINSLSTYWREPVTTGEDSDVVRRGTKLIPVVNLGLEGKPSVIRVFFRNENGIVIGDGITRSVNGPAEIKIAATAGFDDIGMHAAYRTGESPPWIVQVFEAKNPNAPREKFKLLLETEISTDIR